MQKCRLLKFLLLTMLVSLTYSCRDRHDEGGIRVKFDPNKPITISNVYPDSGGIAIPILIDGENFGCDTSGLTVFFKDSLGVKVKAGLVSSNGNKIYAFVPEGLTHKRHLDIEVQKIYGKDTINVKAQQPFIYKTELAVTTVIGQQYGGSQSTKGGDLLKSRLSGPMTICLDDDENIFIVARGNWKYGNTRPVDEHGANKNGMILKADMNNKVVTVLKATGAHLNAPAYSNEEGRESVFVPEDAGIKFFQLSKVANYLPRNLVITATKTEDYNTVAKNNWKHCFVVNKIDHNIYTVFWKGQLVRINPRSKKFDIILDKVGKGNSDSYIAFSPVKGQENCLYVCQADQQCIYKIKDISDITPEDKNSEHGDPFAGRAIREGKNPGTGWEDGPALNAKFDLPSQIAFTKDGRMFIADAKNHCIRMIDTNPSIPDDQRSVITPIGLPQAPGYIDGGPDIAKFKFPTGIAVSPDGKILYVADHGNNVIRKLSIQ